MVQLSFSAVYVKKKHVDQLRLLPRFDINKDYTQENSEIAQTPLEQQLSVFQPLSIDLVLQTRTSAHCQLFIVAVNKVKHGNFFLNKPKKWS